MSRVVKLAAVVGVLLAVSSCATIFSGSDQTVTVETEPVEAMVVIEADTGVEFFNGTAPVTVDLPRGNEYVVTVNLEGYQEQSVPITQSFNTWVIGNIVCGGIPGGVVDFLTGAAWNLEPSQVSVTLRQASNGAESMVFVVFATVDEAGQVRSMAVPMIPEKGLNLASL